MSQSDASPEKQEDEATQQVGPSSRIPKPQFGTLEYRPGESGKPPLSVPDESMEGVKPKVENATAERPENCLYHDHTFKPPVSENAPDSAWGIVVIVVGILIAITLMAMFLSSLPN